MNFIDNALIYKFHTSRILEYGSEGIKSLGWKSEDSQTERFRILAEIGDMTSSSVMDIGCGHGHLKSFLNTLYPGIRYFGIDQMTSFLDIAISRYPEDENTLFFLGDFTTAILPNTDYILASGALSYRSTDPEFIFKTINKLFTNCRLAMGFNLLSKVENQDGILLAYDPDVLAEYCRTLSSNVIIRQDYMEGDFTIFMYK